MVTQGFALGWDVAAPLALNGPKVVATVGLMVEFRVRRVADPELKPGLIWLRDRGLKAPSPSVLFLARIMSRSFY